MTKLMKKMDGQGGKLRQTFLLGASALAVGVALAAPRAASAQSACTTNAGSISAGSSCTSLVLSSGNSGTLVNSGTIRGVPAITIASGAAATTLLNSGLVAGNIVNGSTLALTIAGGTLGTIGTLTGASGGLSSGQKGTITSTGANVTIGGGVYGINGNLLLNDDLNVATGTVLLNSGTVAVNNNITITGNFTETIQTLGSNRLVLNNGTYISVTGRIVTSGGTIVDGNYNATSNYTPGSIHTLLVGGQLSSFNTLMVADSIITGLGLRTTIVNENSISTGTTTTVRSATLLNYLNNYYFGTTSAGLNNTGALDISTSKAAVYIASTGSLGTLTNSGTLGGTAGLSIGRDTATGSVGTVGLIINSGLMQGRVGSGGGIALSSGGSIGSIQNDGTIQGSASATGGIYANGGAQIGALVNGTAGTIQSMAAAAGVNFLGVTVGTVTNSGLIRNTSTGTGFNLTGDVDVFNNTGTGTVTNQSTGYQAGALVVAITAATVANVGNLGTLLNSGLIINTSTATTSGNAIALAAVNMVGGTIDTLQNSGTITSGRTGLRVGQFVAGGTLVNYGHLGLLDNSGLISGSTAAIVKGAAVSIAGGMIGTLVNSGTITGPRAIQIDNIQYGPTVATPGTVGLISNTNLVSATNVAVSIAGGTLGTLLNSGTITAPTAIRVTDYTILSGTVVSYTNAAKVGLLQNSGVIKGTILNLAAQDMTLAGGTGGTIGTFTGVSGLGLISNTVSNVTLASGALLLNDAVDVTGHTLVNSGASVVLNTLLNVTGNFDQSAGTLTLNNGAQVVASGAAIMSGGTVVTSVASNLNYLVGQGGATLVAGGTGSSYSGVAVATTNTVTGLALTSGASGTNLVVMGANDYIGGTLGTLNNTGTISASNAIYVAATGTLGTLSNSGTLMGATAALNNLGGIGTVTLGTQGVSGGVTSYGTVGLLQGGIGLANTGSIGSLTNYATILGTTGAAVDNQGLIVALGNAGTMTGATSGINNAGTIGTLINADMVSGSIGLSNTGLIGFLENFVLGTGSLTTLIGTIHGSATGLRNAGGIGTLFNAGVISGSVALNNAGSIAIIGNLNIGPLVGTISGAATGLLNTGVIGSLMNTGVISGSNYALYNSAGGTLGTIFNAGTISGTIANLSARDLVVMGDTLTIGTLTGGAIANTSSNLVFAGGRQVVDDAINVGANTVVNSGAVLTLTDNVSITGNYSQTTGTLGLGAQALMVSGVASITGGRVIATLSGTQNYIVGTTTGLVVVQAGAGSNYTGVSLTSGVTGLTVGADTQTVGGNVDLMVTAVNDYIGGTLGSLSNIGTLGGVQTAAYIATQGSLGTLSNSGLLDGTRYGIHNFGTIGLVDNSGTATGLIGLYNQGSIGTVVNSGVLKDAPSAQAAGLNNAGTIGVLTNLGTITSPVALYNTGSIGQLNNSGLIAGSLINRSANVLTISGGSGTVVGSLTGTLNGTLNTMGSITSTLGNVVLAGGNLWLNDQVNVAGQTLANSGASLRLSTIINVTGNYSQSAGTIVLAAGAQLSVTGAAVMTGGAVSITGLSATANYLVGQGGTTLVAGGVGSSYSGVSLQANTIAGLVAAAGGVGTNLVVTGANDYVGTLLPTLNNTGSIGGMQTALFVRSTGSIGTVSNSGTLAGVGAVTGYGASIAGTIGTLTNSGVVSGDGTNGGYGLLNRGTIGTLINTVGGTFAGLAGTVGYGLINQSILNTVVNYGLMTGHDGGLQNMGTIQLLDNASGGTIRSNSASAQQGLRNDGTIVTLLNDGLIGNNYGIFQAAGTIQTLVNNGTIAANASGVYMSAAIGTISNSGTISAAHKAIVANSTLTALLNSGTLKGTQALAIGVNGRVGTISNSGVIQGNIVNTGTGGLTIGGGANGTIGTLSGLTGRGTITNTGSSVVFSDGALSLNDNINVGANTVVNSGANLILSNTVNVTGNYSQSSGTLVVNPGVSQLLVSGAASISGGTILTSLSNTGNYLVGSAYTLVQGGAGSNYTGASVVTNSITGLGYASSIATVGGNLDLLLSFNSDYIGGSYGTLVNAGTLNAATVLYIASTGTLGALVNSGTIQGNITNAGSQDLTIIGADNGTFGTLAGQSGMGTIASTLANVVLASGNLALNDRVNVGSHTLVNSGATVQMDNVVSVTGNYSQTGGWLAADYNSGGLVVSGAVSLTGGTVSMYNDTVVRNLMVGDVYGGAVVSGGAGSTFTNLGYYSGVTGLEVTGTVNGNSLYLQAANDYVGTVQGALTNTGTLSGVANPVYLARSATLGTLDNSGALVGTIDGVLNQGTISSVVNTGLISGGTVGWFNQNAPSSVAVLDNQGTLVGGKNGLVNSGTIGALLNSGTITGSLLALYIYPTGTLGTLVNSGTIAGSILNSGQGNLTIAGGVGTGLFTGYGGTVGTITSTGHDVVLASGTLELNDVFNVGSHTVVNNGASLLLDTTLSITGNYSQTGGSLDVGSHTVVVSGIANVSGAAITTSQLDASGNYLVGSISGSVIQGGLGSSYTGISVTSNLTGLSLTGTTGTIGSNVDLMLVSTNDYIGGTLASLDNTGTIAGVVTAAYVATTGSLGTLNNTGLLSADSYGLRNRGTIGLVDNSGTVTGRVALWNQGVIGTVLNTGALLDAPSVNAAGLNNQGTIGAVINQGTIFGTVYGLYNSGSIGSVANAGGTIAGEVALYNGGTIGTVTNSGQIVDGAGPTSAGLNNHGSLGLLDNSGTIAGVTNGLYNTGTIGSVSNSGLITAVTALYTSGLLGTVANSGTISGNIVNDSANALVFTGGSGDTIGTLTGQSGAMGTITSTNANVVLASGNLALNDAVNVGANTLVNSGASVLLNSIVSVTGNFAQTDGTLVAAFGHGELLVSGNAAVTGGTVSVVNVPSTVNFVAGQGGGNALIAAGGTGSYSGLTYVTDLTGLEATGSVSGGNLYLTAANDYVGTLMASLSNTGTINAGNAVYVATSGSLGSLFNSGALTGAHGVHNEGVIATLVNTGVISGYTIGLYNHGATSSMVLLDNQGTIQGNLGVVNEGSLGTLNNSGLLTGSFGAINNTGELDTIVNSGTIAGKIVSTSTHDLTIMGGNATGLFTGINGSIGILTNTASNLVFASGAVRLNEVINVGSHTVVNSGASILLDSTLSITGNYSQASGSLDLSNHNLVVSGVANVSGGAILTSQLDANGNYLVGNSNGTLIQGGAGSSYTGVNITSNLSGLSLTGTTATLGSNVDLLLLSANDYIGGTLASLDNTGTIAGVVTAAYVATTGSLGTLNNTGMLSGENFGLRNLGTIGLLDNSGVVTGRVALWNRGVIGTVVNTGALVDEPSVNAAGLNNQGIIGAVINQGGTIFGTVYGLFNTGSIGSVANSGTIAGEAALYNGGTIGTVTNSGQIIDAAGPVSAGLNNGGSLDLLNNSGTLSGVTNGLYNTGTIGSVVNTGLITAVTALYTSGMLGTVANSGTISGNIVNDSANALVFTGGTGTVFGVLTGQNNALGLITSTNANVVLASGNLLLNDAVNVGTNTLVNSGASLLLSNALSITGNFLQTAGTLAMGVGSSVTGELLVSGAATLTGGTVAVTALDGANLLAGQSYTIVGAGSGTLTATGLTAQVSGFSATLGTASNGGAQDLLLTLLSDYISGTLGTVTNTGVINAATAVSITSNGSLGTLANSGTIIGNVVNDSANDLVIVGGSGTTVGTFAGGTIRNTNSNLTFASGAIALRDTINVGTNTVVNSGASLTLGSALNVTGNFTQTGGTLGLGTQSATISGVADITGGTITTGKLSSTGNYLVGSTNGTLIQGGAGSDYTGAVIRTGILGASVTANNSTVGGNVDLLLVASNDYVGGTLASLDNTSTIAGAAVNTAVFVATRGSIGTLSNSGLLSGPFYGVRNTGTIGLVTNSGTAMGQVGLYNLTSIGTVINTGVLSAAPNNNGIGVAAGLSNGGKIGAVINQGTISNTNYGLYNSGSITSVDNSGLITQTNTVGAAFYNRGTIGSVSNSGLITGVTALRNEGSIGTIANSGTIAGNVLNTVASALVFTGGTGTVTGTLTGRNGAIGTITSTSGNVELASGNLLLNDQVNVGSGTLVNSGANVLLTNAIGVTGNYAQSAGTLAMGIGSGTAGELLVSGNAAFTGGTVAVTALSGSNLIAGQSYTIAEVGGSLTTSGLSAAATGFSATLGTGANGAATDLLLTLLSDYVSGTLGTLTNTGTINAATAVLITSAGSLGTLANSGVLIGNVINASANDLVIVGGSPNGVNGGTVGSFSGGTIRNSLSNLTFASGAVSLSDNIDATGHTVANTGATIALASDVSISGAYSQAAGTLGLGGHVLSVSDAASISGGVVNGGLNGAANYLVGDGVTLVQGGAGSNYSGATVVSGLTGLDATGTTSGSNLLAVAGNDYIGASLAVLNVTGTLANNAGGATALYIARTGTLGSLANSGTIRGNITNLSAGDLSITGGSNGTVGVFTGGTIRNAGSNVVFASGAVSLGDVIVATGHTVANTGASISLAGDISVTGAYSQTAGTLGLGGHVLSVSDAASVTGGVVNGGLNGAANYLVGDGVVLIQGGAGSNYTGATVVSGLTGLSANGGTSGGNLLAVAGNDYIGASLATLNVTGTLANTAGGATALYIAGTGTLGSLANSGLISGNVVNTSTHDLTINGSGNGAVGRFTGGTITSTGANVVFASGAVSLGDAITVATHTVSNAGASIALASDVAVTGNFAQSSGTLTTGGHVLTVSGAATVAGGVVNAGVSAVGNYLAGDSVTLIQGGTGSNYAGATVTSGITGLSANAVTSGSNLLAAAANDYIGASLDTLNNTGTVASPTALYIASTGTLGTLANSGALAGNITNLSTGDLIINGGSLASPGTLTGFNGAIGTISNTGSNVRFTGGVQLLNDHITVGSHTVFNSGATLLVNSAINITGSYSQSAGTLAIGVTSQSSYGNLAVSGAAAFTGGSVLLQGVGSGAGALQAGTYTIASGNGLSLSGVDFTATGYTVTSDLVTVGGTTQLVVKVAGKATNYTAVGNAQGGAAVGTGSALDQIAALTGNSITTNPQLAAFTQQVLAPLATLTPAAKQVAVAQLSPSQLTPQLTAASVTPTTTAISQHQETVASLMDGSEKGAAAGSNGREGVIWGEVVGAGVLRGTTTEAAGYRASSSGLVLGADWFASDEVMAGLAFSWINSASVGQGVMAGSLTRVGSYQLTAYSVWRPDFADQKLSVEGQVGWGYNHFDQRRDIAFLGARANANYGGEQYLGKVTVGYDLPQQGAFTFTPQYSLRFVRLVNHAYQEHDAGPANLKVDVLGTNAVTQELGLKVDTQWNTGVGLLSPDLRVAWVHDFKDGPIPTTGVLAGVAFASTTGRVNTDGLAVNLGATLQQSETFSLRLEYNGEYRHDYQSHGGVLRASWSF
ncbi:uncharacterized protein with beta-barrel porin domain [Nitrospirillum viridazoti]|uniref:hypothetical protein n=1 Tax=Nitrospirillum viridazoti TaxID=3144925 RepID=UPI0011ABFAC7|nr:hypothetical protein [Nitrospirillum amazonense]TWB40655.1 uncharacterized protein with beta-barrel porin domain [Nitrospirillum amazonense]